MNEERFLDRHDAGRRLARVKHMQVYADRGNVVVLGLPRGGVPVAHEVAKHLHAPLDVLVVRKLGVPIQPELAMGAMASGGAYVLNQGIIDRIGISKKAIQKIITEEEKKLLRQENFYRDCRTPVAVQGRTTILVDDGLATGASMRAAVQALRSRRPDRIVVAVPVASVEAFHEFKKEIDEIVCVMTPTRFNSVGQWYENFSQTTDQDVRELLFKENH